MIHLLTGLPGSGKSLRTVYYIERFLKEGRPVYACGVDELSMPGVMPLDDPNAWQELPDGAVIVVDEAQKLWPSRRGAEPIPPVRALSEHRHQGKDFVLVTQHPTMLDSYVRRLVGRHEHLVRKFGLAASHIFSWNEVQDDPANTTSRELAEESLWTYPKHLFGFYKSATMHTVKRRVPKSLLVIVGACILIPALAWSAYSSISSYGEKPEHQAEDPKGEAFGLPNPSPVGPLAVEPLLDAQTYITKWTPRVAGVPWSAPAYDGFEVKDYPRPHCIIVGDQRKERVRCKCYTQQVTPMDLDDASCIAIARNGYWDPFKAPEQEQRREALDQQQHADAVPVQASGAHSGTYDRSLLPVYVPPEQVPDYASSR